MSTKKTDLHKPAPLEALHSDLLAIRDGITLAARALHRSPQTMYNRFSDGDLQLADTLGAAQFVRSRTGATGFAEAVACEFGGVFVPLSQVGDAADDDVLDAYLAATASLGELARKMAEARADGVLDPVEFEALQQESSRLVSRIQALMMALAHQVREVPVVAPKSIRRVA